MGAGTCKLCGRTIAQPSEGTMMAAFGRPLFLVHKESCMPMVKGGVTVAGLLAIQGAKMLLKNKAPRFSALLESAVATTREVNQHGRQ